MTLQIGAPAPWFVAETRSTPQFHFSAAGGRFVLLALIPDAGPAQSEAIVALLRARPHFDDQQISAFAVVGDRDLFDRTGDQMPGLRWMLDPLGEIAAMYGALDEQGARLGRWVLIDPMLRALRIAPCQDAASVFAQIADLGPAEDHAGAPLTAPVLLLPRVFEPEFCRRLIEVYEQTGGAPSGVMRQVGERTVAVMDASKNRRDAMIEDPGLRREVLQRLSQRLIPEVRKAFQFNATRIERYVVACYDAAEGGYFRAHRDDTTAATAHRRFACSINLNAEAFEGGDLVFPEFGGRRYRPPTGGAVVFSCSLLHEATRVEHGRRFAFLPFLYDEAGEALRLANAAHLVSPTTSAPQEDRVTGDA